MAARAPDGRPDADPAWWPKVEAGVAATASSALARRGIQPAEPLAILIIILETIGGICVALGLFTRFWATRSPSRWR
jgi:hypothetical protein